MGRFRGVGGKGSECFSIVMGVSSCSLVLDLGGGYWGLRAGS